MATDKLSIVVDAVWRGKNALDKAGRDLKSTQEAARKNSEGLRHLASQAAQAGGAMVAAGAVFKKTWDIVGEGANIQQVANTFDSLAASINTTSDVMLNKLRDASAGMVADFDLMQSANRFTAMGLASTADEAAKLTNISTQLGAAMGKGPTEAMEEFALLLANQSIPRLDTFGISAGAVRTRMAELQTGVNALDKETAFLTAVMEQADKTMVAVGDSASGTAGDVARVEAQFANLTASAKEFMAVRLAGVVGGVSDTMGVLNTDVAQARSGWDNFKIAAAEVGKVLSVNDTIWDNVIEGVKEGDIVVSDMTATMELAATVTDGWAINSARAAEAQAQMAQATIDYSAAAAEANPISEDLSERMQRVADVSDNVAQVGLPQYIKDANDRMADLAASSGEAAGEVDSLRGRVEAIEGTYTATVNLEAYGLDTLERANRALQAISGFNANDQPDPYSGEGDRGRGQGDEFDRGRGQDWDSGGSTPTGGSRGDDRAQYASGTNGWQRVPGPPGKPYPVTLHGGEPFNVMPVGSGMPSGGGMSTGDIIININGGAGLSPQMLRQQVAAGVADSFGQLT